jgi:hypothetical protein
MLTGVGSECNVSWQCLCFLCTRLPRIGTFHLLIELSVLSHKATYILAVYAQEVVDALRANDPVHA